MQVILDVLGCVRQLHGDGRQYTGPLEACTLLEQKLKMG